MQGERKFSHITVTPDEEDDVVIQAGVRSTPRAADSSRRAGAEGDVVDGEGSDGESAEGRLAASEAKDAPSGDRARVSSEAVDGASEEGPVAASDEASARDAAGAKPPQRKVSQKEPYHETTMEDLESTPMSGMQKAIIVLALLLIVAAVVYYFVVMR